MLVMNDNGRVPEMKRRGVADLRWNTWRAQSKLIGGAGLLLSAVIYLQSSLERVKLMTGTLLERLLSAIDVSRNSSFLEKKLSLHTSGRGKP